MTYHDTGDLDHDPYEWAELVDKLHGPESEDEKWERLHGWYDDREAEVRERHSGRHG